MASVLYDVAVPAPVLLHRLDSWAGDGFPCFLVGSLAAKALVDEKARTACAARAFSPSGQVVSDV